MSEANLSILQKADLTIQNLSNDGGYMPEASAKSFIRHFIKQAAVLPDCQVVGMKSHTQKVPGIYFNEPVLRGGNSGQALAQSQRSKPKTTDAELKAVLLKAQIDLDDETLEDNIEQNTLETTILQLLSERIGSDLDKLTINGDTASADNLLSQWDGMLKTTISHVVDHGGTQFNDDLCLSLMEIIPTPAIQKRDRMKFYTSVKSELRYRHVLSQRGDALGVSVHGSSAPVNYSGVIIKPVEHFPEDQGVSQDESSVIFCDPKNWVHGVWRKIKINKQYNAPEGKMHIVATMRMHGVWALEDYTAKGIRLKVA